MKISKTKLLELLEKLIEEFREHSLLCPKPYTPSRLLDHACGKLIESKCIQPTFLIGHPTFLSPLAKEHPQIVNLFIYFFCFSFFYFLRTINK